MPLEEAGERKREAMLAWRNSNGVEDEGESANEGESEGKIKALGWRGRVPQVGGTHGQA